MNPLTMDLLNGSFVFPNALINETGPLPIAPPGQMGTPDGLINKADQTKLLQNGLTDMIYSFGPNPARITTQTQNNIPNKVQRIIPKLFIPAAQSGAGIYRDPILEHATNDGDLVFTIKINKSMAEDSNLYVQYPAGYSHGAVKLINLATVNYILWGLQVGTTLAGGNSMWLKYFTQLCKGDQEPLLTRLNQSILSERDHVLQEMVWNFIRTYISPFGIQHGFDTQGGQHEGSRTKVVTNAVDYVSAFAVEGKLIKVNNLWKASDVYEDDDLVLALRYVPPRPTSIPFNLSSSSRSYRAESAPALIGWWCLIPEVLVFKSIIDTPHIHIGRSQKMVTSYANPQFGLDMPQWNARSSLGGTPLQMTFEPCFMQSDSLYFKSIQIQGPDTPKPGDAAPPSGTPAETTPGPPPARPTLGGSHSYTLTTKRGRGPSDGAADGDGAEDSAAAAFSTSMSSSGSKTGRQKKVSRILPQAGSDTAAGQPPAADADAAAAAPAP